VVTCYGTIWQKVLLQFTSCVNWSEHYSNPSTPPLREAIASYEAALDDLQCKQAEVGGLKEKLAAATSRCYGRHHPSKLKGPAGEPWNMENWMKHIHELTTSVVWATKRMAYKQSTWPNLTVCTRFNIKILMLAGLEEPEHTGDPDWHAWPRAWTKVRLWRDPTRIVMKSSNRIIRPAYLWIKRRVKHIMYSE